MTDHRTKQTEYREAQNATVSSESPVPVAMPAAAQSVSATPLVRAVSDGSVAKTAPPSSVSDSPRRAEGSRLVGRRQLAELADKLSERDLAVLAELAAHRYLTSHQLAGLIFTGHASPATGQRVCRRVLTRLERLRLIRRLERRVGGQRGGSSLAVWQLSPAGARLLNSQTDAAGLARGRCRPHEPSPRVLRHCLAVADTHLGLRDISSMPAIENVAVQLEPICWRRYAGLGGESRWLKPDLAAVITGGDEHGTFEDRWFIEVDLATESVATLQRKCQQYQDYRQSGSEQAQAGGGFPLVLWVMHGPRGPERAQQLAAKVARDSRLDPALYRYVTPDTLTEALLGASS